MLVGGRLLVDEIGLLQFLLAEGVEWAELAVAAPLGMG